MTALPLDSSARHLLLPLEGCHNFRQVAGWQTTDGRRLREGLLFRSDGLDRLSDNDHNSLRELRIRQVFDLRASAEMASAPSRWPADFQPPVWAGAESAAEGDINRLMAREDVGPAHFSDAMKGVYASFPEELAEAVSHVARSVLADDEGPVLIHCTAGKDRTGFVTAMLLHAIGIRREDIFADYLLTNASYATALTRFNINGRLDAVEAKAAGALAALVGVHAEYLEAAEGSIVEEFGSIDAWLEARVGLNAETRRLMHDRLLV